MIVARCWLLGWQAKGPAPQAQFLLQLGWQSLSLFGGVPTAEGQVA
jgi:hypothetical protein